MLLCVLTSPRRFIWSGDCESAKGHSNHFKRMKRGKDIVMLKARLEKTKVDGEVVSQAYVAERISFAKPAYINTDNIADFRDTCFRLSDYIRITDAVKALEKSGKNADLEKVQAMLHETSLPYHFDYDEDEQTCDFHIDYPDNVSRLVWGFCIGLDFVKPDRVPVGFSDTYIVIRKYLNDYLDCNDWDEVRKQKYNEIRTSCEDIMNEVIRSDERAKQDFNLHLSAKAFNLFLNACKIMNNQNDKKLTRATVVKMKKPEECYKELMKAVNTCTGVTRDGVKGKEIKVF